MEDQRGRTAVVVEERDVPPNIIITPRVKELAELILTGRNPEAIKASLLWLHPFLKQ